MTKHPQTTWQSLSNETKRGGKQLLKENFKF